MNEIKYTDVPLTEDELEVAVMEEAKMKTKIEIAKLHLKHLKIDEENKYSERMSVLNARESLKNLKNQMETELNTCELNLKVFERQVKTNMKEVPMEDEVNETVETQPDEVEKVEESTEEVVEESE